MNEKKTLLDLSTENDEDQEEKIRKLREKWDRTFPELMEKHNSPDKKVLLANERLDRQVNK